MVRRLVHVITPGDHFSPGTGSAIPTVVDGLASAADRAGAPGQAVLVDRQTYPDRYSSARAVEYDQRPHVTRLQRAVDLMSGRLVGVRPFQRRQLGAAIAGQGRWPASVLVAHNLVGLVPLVDRRRHQPVLYCHNDLLRTYTKAEAGRTLDGAAAIVCVSDHLAETTRSQLPTALHERVVTVHNGVDCETFHPRREPRADGLVHVAFVGRVVPEKGADVLLDAVRLLDRRELVVTIIGSAGFDPDAPLSPYESSLRGLAARCRAKVAFRRFADRRVLPALLREQDVLACPSRWAEPSTLTVPEGQASGLPVIASRVGGIPEVAAVPELLVPPDDPRALAEALDGLADSVAWRSLTAERSRRYALEHDWSRSWHTLTGALDGLLR